jgi:hypothetical protein
MAFGATDVVAPMLTPAEVVMFLAPGVTSEARFRYFFLRLVFERNYLGRIGFLHVCAAGTMTRFASRRFVLPTSDL